MNVQPVDVGDELRESVQLRLTLTPIVLRRPIASELLRRRELYALGCAGDRFALRPLCRLDAPAQVGELRVRHFYVKRSDVGSFTARELSNISHHIRHSVDPP